MDPKILNKFIAPMEEQLLTNTFPPIPTALPAYRTHVALDQVPPADRGELKAFQTVARGTANVLAAGRPEEGKPLKGLKDIWAKSQFKQAPEVLELDVSLLSASPDANGKKKIVRLIPERFERGRVQRPKMMIEEVDVTEVYGDDEGLKHPSQRRWAHDTAVNARLGAQALKEAHMQKTKLSKNLRFNYPHGALGFEESPYDASRDAEHIYSNGEQLQKETSAANRKGRGGKAPKGVLGGLLKGDAPEIAEPKRGGKKTWKPQSTFSVAKMAE